jgi:hypothetical protein
MAISQVRNEEKARRMLGPDIDLVSKLPIKIHTLLEIVA